MAGSYYSLSGLWHFWPVFVSSFICALGATLFCKKIAIKYGIVDRPDAFVKTHKEPIAYLGGVGILIGLTIGILIGLLCLQGANGFDKAMHWLLGILVGSFIACFVGLVDDIFILSPGRKILGQLLPAIVLLMLGIRPTLHYFSDYLGIYMSPVFEKITGIPIVIIFVLGATNSLNLLDGLDGLCAGVTAIITLAMLVLSILMAGWFASEVGDPVRIIICLAMLGGICGFLPLNTYPAKIFMGDAGSMLLGFLAATMMIMFAEGTPRWWFASILIFGLPILDTATAVVRRLVNKRPLFISDRGHIYDQLIDRGISLSKTVIICYFLAGMYALSGLIISQISSVYAFWVYLAIIIVSGIVIWTKGFLKMEGLRGAIQKNNIKSHNSRGANY